MSEGLRISFIESKLPSPSAPEINWKKYAELARLSANLNQLMHHANSGNAVNVDTELLPKIYEQLNLHRLELVGLPPTQIEGDE